jgi:hypothetical protein
MLFSHKVNNSVELSLRAASYSDWKKMLEIVEAKCSEYQKEFPTGKKFKRSVSTAAGAGPNKSEGNWASMCRLSKASGAYRVCRMSKLCTKRRYAQRKKYLDVNDLLIEASGLNVLNGRKRKPYDLRAKRCAR